MNGLANESPIYSIGHSTRTIERLIDILHSHSVTLLVDIRRIPRSLHNPQFNEEVLRASLKKARIKYIHLIELGGLRASVKESQNTAWENRSFRAYADCMQTEEFQTALDKLLKLAKSDTVAIMCAEGNPFMCHRRLVDDALSSKGVKVIEISSNTSGRPHEMTEFALVTDGRVSYPGEAAEGPKTAKTGTKEKRRKSS